MLTPARWARAQQIAQEYSIGRSTLWAYKKQPGFPQPVKLSPRCTLWNREEVAAWFEAQRTTSTNSEVTAA
jgi:prophage regulatory protein